MNLFPSCPLCRNVSRRLIHRKGMWAYYSCRSCRIVFLFPGPAPAELTSAYQDYLPVQEAAIEQWHRAMEDVIQSSADWIEKEAGKPGRLLDVGSGYGFFLDCMSRRGWQAEGLEISEFGRAFTRKRFPGIGLHEQPLFQCAFPDRSYDVVTLFYVIEHLPDPVGLLKEVGRILKPGGLVLLRWPHSTPIVRLLGPLARGLDLYHTPYHLFDYTRSFLERTLHEEGFSSVKTLVLGKTRPASFLGKWSSRLMGGLGEFLSHWTKGRWLLPGVSKTTLAKRPYSRVEK